MREILEGTPQQAGYRMPAEWAEHAATWIAWPHNAEDWPGKFQAIPWVYADIVRPLSRVETVNIFVNDGAAEKRAHSILRRSGANLEQVKFHQVPTDRVWTRDSGPIFVKGPNGLAVTNWHFNAWAKYDNWHHDDKLPGYVGEALSLPVWTPRVGDRQVVLEGGSIDTNGAGVLLTTEECLLSRTQQRNPGLSREDLEKIFHDYLGIEQVIWLNRGILGDDTHGHVDDITRFVDENTIVTVTEPNLDDDNHYALRENLERLKDARNLKGEPYRIVELPMPAPVVFDGQRLPASYGNFYIANGIVLVPTFNDLRDRKALEIIAGLFPDREVIGIHCGDFIWGLGALHCMTQQQPL
ncbi:agmatine deiminase family protein [Silvibacterium acidisoli]|uniref:agmatine deiminase family protein n=1 Tax=Acidobacteriaceae bacterium ZG23-2 TaxID=2883246 RepID=UPI00406D381E